MANDRPESLISGLKAIGEFALMIFGIIGFAVMIFSDQGLLKKLIEKLSNAAFSSSLGAVLAIIVGLVLVKLWYDRVFSKAENANALGNFLMKAMMIAGAYFLYHFITTGSFKI